MAYLGISFGGNTVVWRTELVFDHNAYMKEYNRTYYKRPDVREKNRIKSLKYNRQLKEEMFLALGTICACCGFADKRFLSLDHINNDGKSDPAGCLRRFYAKQRNWDKTIYQILCYNCNCGKQSTGICPHKELL